MPSLSEEAIRLRRTDWQDTQMLAEELAAMLRSETEDTTGPIFVNMNDDNRALSLLSSDPVPALHLPVVDFDHPNPLELVTKPVVLRRDNSDGTEIEDSTIETISRGAFPGRVISRDVTGYYNTELFTNSLIYPPTIVRAYDLRGQIVFNGTWAIVHKHERLQIVTSTLRDRNTRTVLSKKTTVRVLSRSYYGMFSQIGPGGPSTVTPPWGQGPGYDQPPPVTRMVRFRFVVADQISGLWFLTAFTGSANWPLAQTLFWAPSTLFSGFTNLLVTLDADATGTTFLRIPDWRYNFNALPTQSNQAPTVSGFINFPPGLAIPAGADVNYAGSGASIPPSGWFVAPEQATDPATLEPYNRRALLQAQWVS